MTIGTSNVSFSSIATEVGVAANSNISLKDVSQKQMILNPANSRQTFTLTDSLSLNAQDSATSDNMNLASGPNETSQWKSYNKNDVVFSSSSATSSNTETINHNSNSSGGCIAVAALSAEIYCKRVSNDLVWYINESTFASAATHRKEGTSGTYSNVEVARLAGVGADTATTVSVGYTTLENTGVDGQTTASSSGSTNSNLNSTNTKIGFKFVYQGQAECTGSGGRTVRQRFQLAYTVTKPSHNPRIFNFFVGLRGVVTTTAPECC